MAESNNPNSNANPGNVINDRIHDPVLNQPAMIINVTDIELPSNVADPPLPEGRAISRRRRMSSTESVQGPHNQRRRLNPISSPSDFEPPPLDGAEPLDDMHEINHEVLLAGIEDEADINSLNSAKVDNSCKILAKFDNHDRGSPGPPVN